jgi:hypothetical protein
LCRRQRTAEGLQAEVLELQQAFLELQVRSAMYEGWVWV